MASKKVPKHSPRKRKNVPVRTKRSWVFMVVILLFFIIAGYVAYLDAQVRAKFNGKKWSLPAKVFAEPVSLYAGADLTQDEFIAELKALGFRQVVKLDAPGQFQKLAPGHWGVFVPVFDFPDSRGIKQKVTVQFEQGRIKKLIAQEPLVRLPAREIGGFYPDHREDRLLIRLDELPPLLGEGLIAVEDKYFADHFGISFRSVARAALVNVKAGRVVQGGSTLTQQLVKNFYLNSQRSWLRKFNEAIMALLLEFHYSKAEILEAYVNEVYLGQHGPRAIHGFALASQHYFAKSLDALSISEVAFLVGVVKGASYYNPWRSPERAIDRRNLVLAEMHRQGLIDAQQFTVAKNSILQVREQTHRALQPYPAFMALVRDQLARDYNDHDLSSEGLRIFTSLNPRLQDQLQSLSAKHLTRLEATNQLEPNSLQTASVVASVTTGEIQAYVADRRARYAGFNRAYEMRRPVGSLVKPAVYLQAIKSGYRLTDAISDAPVTVQGPKGEHWQPENFDRKNHGSVSLFRALANSYNLATVRLGMQLGLDQVAEQLELMGLGSVPEIPAMLLGAVERSPLQVAQFYHTLAADGFYTPLKAIRAVQTQRGQLLQRYSHQVDARIEPRHSYLIKYALSEALISGTAQSAQSRLPESSLLAGKTGTSDDQRDSWFAGFSGERVAVIWVGRDDNGVTPLTGSSGALPIWADFMAEDSGAGIASEPPEGVEFYWVDDASHKLSGENCQGSIYLPFLVGTEPTETVPCQYRANPIIHWWQKLWR